MVWFRGRHRTVRCGNRGHEPLGCACPARSARSDCSLFPFLYFQRQRQRCAHSHTSAVLDQPVTTMSCAQLRTVLLVCPLLVWLLLVNPPAMKKLPGYISGTPLRSRNRRGTLRLRGSGPSATELDYLAAFPGVAQGAGAAVGAQAVDAHAVVQARVGVALVDLVQAERAREAHGAEARESVHPIDARAAVETGAGKRTGEPQRLREPVPLTRRLESKVPGAWGVTGATTPSAPDSRAQEVLPSASFLSTNERPKRLS